ncbi:MAG: hypothetical protein ACK41T_06030 [Pseudobdellovibrio sp.]
MTEAQHRPINFDDVSITDFYANYEKTSTPEKISAVDNRLPADEGQQLKMTLDYTPGKLFSVIKQPTLLTQLEKSGYSLADHLGHLS